MTLKSSFLPEESERRILKDYCRDIRPRSSLSICILGLWPKPRTRVCPRRRKSLSEKTMLVNKEVSFGHNGLRGWAEDKCILD